MKIILDPLFWSNHVCSQGFQGRRLKEEAIEECFAVGDCVREPTLEDKLADGFEMLSASEEP